MQDQVEIRNIKEEDLKEIAFVHQLAFPDSALTMLGSEAICRYYQWQLSGGSKQLLAIGGFKNKKLIGFCFAGVFHGALKGFIFKNLFFLVRTILFRPGLFSEKIFRKRLKLGIQVFIRNIFSIDNKVKKEHLEKPVNTFGVLAIAVHPDYRKQGVGRMLLQSIEFTAKQRGFNKIRLTVRVDNEGAARFYQNSGYVKVAFVNGVWSGSLEKSL